MTATASARDGRLLSLTYTSSVTRLLSVAQLVELIEQIRPSNERLGVTGLLLYSGGNVVQSLEGEAGVVDELFGVIGVDPRHADVRVVERTYVEERAFSSWSMGFGNIGSRRVADLTDFVELARQSVGDDLSAHAAAAFELLERFRITAVD